MHLHWFKSVELTHSWNYQQCRCEKRRALRTTRGGYVPYPEHWVKTGKHVDMSTIRPPVGGSGMSKGIY